MSLPFSTKSGMYVHIRNIIRRDMASVLEIERKSFEFPWSEDDFIRSLRERNHIGMVAESQDAIAGFMIYELQKSRVYIRNFAVHPNYRHRQVGSQMVEILMNKLSARHRNRILLEVRETNLVAQIFFRSCGFRAIGIRRKLYQDTLEDAYLMEYRLLAEEQQGFFPNNRIAYLAV